MREAFDREISDLQNQLLKLGEMVEKAIVNAVDALRKGDKKTARKLIASDQEINEKRYEIEHNCLILVATQQPLASDLRLLAAVLEIITELERIGDYAKGIAHICILLENNDDMPTRELKQMTKLGLSMLQNALQAFIAQDVEAARTIPQQDDEIDKLYNKVYRKLLKRMTTHPNMIDNASHLLWAAHNLERMADRVTNICERIIFVVTGEISEISQSDDEIEKMLKDKEKKSA